MKVRKFGELNEHGKLNESTEDSDQPIVYVMDMEYKWTTVYKVPKQLYDEIIEKYSSLQKLYDASAGRVTDNVARDYVNKILEYPTLDIKDGFVSY